jgi:hypothetical protein
MDIALITCDRNRSRRTETVEQIEHAFRDISKPTMVVLVSAEKGHGTAGILGSVFEKNVRAD